NTASAISAGQLNLERPVRTVRLKSCGLQSSISDNHNCSGCNAYESFSGCRICHLYTVRIFWVIDLPLILDSKRKSDSRDNAFIYSRHCLESWTYLSVPFLLPFKCHVLFSKSMSAHFNSQTSPVRHPGHKVSLIICLSFSEKPDVGSHSNTFLISLSDSTRLPFLCVNFTLLCFKLDLAKSAGFAKSSLNFSNPIL